LRGKNELVAQAKKAVASTQEATALSTLVGTTP
jgi:hypothetical protein